MFIFVSSRAAYWCACLLGYIFSVGRLFCGEQYNACKTLAIMVNTYRETVERRPIWPSRRVVRRESQRSTLRGHKIFVKLYVFDCDAKERFSLNGEILKIYKKCIYIYTQKTNHSLAVNIFIKLDLLLHNSLSSRRALRIIGFSLYLPQVMGLKLDSEIFACSLYNTSAISPLSLPRP